MLFPNVKILECRRERLHAQFIARSEVFVEAPNRNARFLHHISNADAFQTEFAKPLGSNAHDPSVRLRLVTLRIAHSAITISSRAAWIAPGRKSHWSIIVLFID